MDRMNFFLIGCDAAPAANSVEEYVDLLSAIGQRGSATAMAAKPKFYPTHNPQNAYLTTILVSTWTRLYKSITSRSRMRMQPDDTLRPISSGSLVPWMR